MDVLILSCDTGEGHNHAAKAIKHELENRGNKVTMLDMFKLRSDNTARVVAQTYINTVVNSPNVFGTLYHIASGISKLPWRSPVYFANSLMGKYLEKYLETNKYDVIVTPHLFASETLTYLKRKGKLRIPTISVVTDYTCIPFLGETDLDYCIIPDEGLLEEFTTNGIKPDSIRPYGIPVDKTFNDLIDQKESRKNLGLPLNKHLFLVMGGSMGFGSVDVLTDEILQNAVNKQVVIIAGKNAKLQEELSKKYQGNDEVLVCGFTDRIHEYMSACDVIFTKPGGLTSTEVLVLNRPLVLMNPIPGCETHNQRFFTQRHVAYSAKTIQDQVALGIYLVENPEQCDKMMTNQKLYAKPDAAKKIADLVSEIGGA